MECEPFTPLPEMMNSRFKYTDGAGGNPINMISKLPGVKQIGQRVIYDELREILEPEHTALVVWNTQNSLVSKIFNTEEFKVNMGKLIASARMAHILMFFNRYSPSDSSFEFAWAFYISMLRNGISDPLRLPRYFDPGTEDDSIHPCAAPGMYDTVLKNSSMSIFYGTQFEHMIRAAGITTLLFSGIGTELGIENSVRDSSMRGFYTIVCSDCVSSMNRPAHELSLRNMGNVAVILKLREITDTWLRARSA